MLLLVFHFSIENLQFAIFNSPDLSWHLAEGIAAIVAAGREPSGSAEGGNRDTGRLAPCR